MPENNKEFDNDKDFIDHSNIVSITVDNNKRELKIQFNNTLTSDIWKDGNIKKQCEFDLPFGWLIKRFRNEYGTKKVD